MQTSSGSDPVNCSWPVVVPLLKDNQAMLAMLMHSMCSEMCVSVLVNTLITTTSHTASTSHCIMQSHSCVAYSHMHASAQPVCKVPTHLAAAAPQPAPRDARVLIQAPHLQTCIIITRILLRPCRPHLGPQLLQPLVQPPLSMALQEALENSCLSTFPLRVRSAHQRPRARTGHVIQGCLAQQ
jgi:hypothetical protein